MKQSILWACFALATACTVSEKPSKLVWSDEFDSTGFPDSSHWNYDLGTGPPENWGNNELQYYTRNPSNVRVENGMLVIEARKDSLGGKTFTSARLVSRQKGDWQYGRIEVKAKLPHGKGTWPAIWMLSTDWKYGGWPSSGEIDIMEHVGHDPGVIHGTLHAEVYNKSKQEGTITVPDVQEAFHIYAIDWSETKIDFYVDDKIYHSVQHGPTEDYREWPFDQRFYLILNIAVGGNWGGAQGVDENIWPQRMEVDYVRVYR